MEKHLGRARHTIGRRTLTRRLRYGWIPFSPSFWNMISRFKFFGIGKLKILDSIFQDLPIKSVLLKSVQRIPQRVSIQQIN
jgi:hypothetical protein